MTKLSDAINNQIARAIQNHLDNGIPADRLRNQVPSRAIPPATPTAKGGVTISNATPQAVGTAASGTNSSVARDDHVHAHGNQAGGALHANATTSVAGFQSATDKSKEDKYPAISGLTPGNVLTVLTATTIDFQAPVGGSGITIQEVDGTPSESAPTKLIFPNGTLVVSSHEVTYTPTGGGTSENHILIVDSKSPGTAGGTFTTGAWQTRDLNTERYDTGSNASVASNQITLDAGTYRCRIQSPAWLVNQNQIRLYDITNSTVLVVGSNAYATRAGSDMPMSLSIAVGRFTLSGSTVLEVQQQCQSTQATNGFGLPMNGAFTVTEEVYTMAEFWKE